MRACRICLTKNDLSPLFGDLSVVRFTSKQLFVATGVQIHHNDGFPQYACSSCIDLIKSSLHLRTISTQANINLKQILQKSINKDDIFTDDFLTDKFDIESNFNDLVKTEDLDNNSDNSGQYISDENQNDDLNNVIEVPNINETNYESTGMKVKKTMKRKLKKWKKIEKLISIDDLESSDSNDGFSEEINIKIEDFESDSEIDGDFKFDKSLDRELNISDIVNNKSKFNNSLTTKDIANCNSLSINNVNDNITNECNKNDNNHNIQSNYISNSKLKINDVSTKTNKLSPIKLNDRKYYNLTNLDDSVVQNVIQKKLQNKIGTKKKIRKVPQKVTVDNETINNHLLTRHDNKNYNAKYYALVGKTRGAAVQCKACKNYLSRNSFLGHAIRHFEPEFVCEDCGKLFHTKILMRYHQQRLHGRPKKLACDKCDYTANHGIDLTNHVRVSHSGERPFICDVCNATFPLKRNIVQHLKRHFGVRNVQCDKCPKMLRSKSELWNHQHKVHFDNYEYNCYLCPETYKTKNPVKKHLLNVHGIPEDQQLKVKYVRSKRTTGLAKDLIPSRNYFRNIELKSD